MASAALRGCVVPSMSTRICPSSKCASVSRATFRASSDLPTPPIPCTAEIATAPPPVSAARTSTSSFS
jgi:hypothetical protein